MISIPFYIITFNSYLRKILKDKELQSHAGGGGGGGHAMFHGQGGASDMNKEELEQYLHKIAKAVDHTLQGQHAPLLFVGIEEEFGMLRKHLSYAQLADQPLSMMMALVVLLWSSGSTSLRTSTRSSLYYFGNK